jgi:hypothetical protein
MGVRGRWIEAQRPVTIHGLQDTAEAQVVAWILCAGPLTFDTARMVGIW